MGHKPLLKIFTGNTDSEKCNTWGLEATTIPRCVKVQNIKGIANILADSVSRLRTVGLYHDLDFKDGQQELRTPFEPLPPVEQSTHIPTEVQEIFIKPNIENLMLNYDTQNTLPVTQPGGSKLSLDNASPEDIPQLEQNNVPTRVDPRKNNPTTKNNIFCNIIIQHMHCNTSKKYFANTMGILHKKVIDFNSTFSSVVIPKYSLNTYYMLPMIP